jgi:molecular chaperone DnaK
VPQIEVTFDIDANGILHVSAKDLGTGKEQKIRIEASSGLNEDEINKMVKDAEAHAEEDKKAREAVEAKNEADSLIYSTEKSLKDYGDKITDADREAINSAISDLRGVMDGNDLDAIKEKIEALKQASYKLAEEVYKQQSAEQQEGGAEAGGPGAGAEGGAAGAAGGEENVQDADYEVVDDDENEKQ